MGDHRTNEKLARLCWPDAYIRASPSGIVEVSFLGWHEGVFVFDPTTDANDWERVVGVLVERGLTVAYSVQVSLSGGNCDSLSRILTAPLPDRCAAALVVLEREQYEQKEQVNG